MKQKGGEENMTKRIFASVIATFALLVNVVAPVAAETVSLEISGNGQSTNDIEVDMDQSTGVIQENEANINNNIKVVANSGNNNASRNTGGDTSVSTGDATTQTMVSNTANTNVADVEPCNGCGGSVEAIVSGNGYGSDNNIDLDLDQGKDSGTYVTQSNRANVSNAVRSNADTGSNGANYNTGGAVEVSTGNAMDTVVVANALNTNSAVVGGGSGGSVLSAKILENGGNTTNDISLDLDRELLVEQRNMARVRNNVNANARTGNNLASRNTSGMVSIMTGNADTYVGVDTMANFNAANVDCDCMMGVSAKIAGNGWGSDNNLVANLDGSNWVVQENGGQNRCPFRGCFPFWNKDGIDTEVGASALTGNNKAGYNGGDVEGDPSIMTGNSSAGVEVENTGNSNTYGSMPDWDWEDAPWSGVNLNISFDLSDLLSFLVGNA